MTNTCILLYVSLPFLVPSPTHADPITNYDESTLRGWRVVVNRELSWEEPALHRDTLALLDRQLQQVERAVPPIPLEQLRAVTIWVELVEPHHPCMAYHPDAGWLRDHDMNPLKARCVEISNARHFLDWSRNQPWMVFHELAHAYHHRVLGFDDPTILHAFQAASAARNYESVLHVNGQHGQRHYALTNPMEYFAELSESTFGKNDFYPFLRSELAVHDPLGLSTVERAWRLPGSP